MVSHSLKLATLVAAAFVTICTSLTGCGSTASISPPVSGAALHGIVHGGQQPVTGSTIQLFAAGTSGYGTGATSLLTTPVTTDPTGAFTLTGDYTCPSSTSQLYLVSTGGNPGLTAGTNNASLVLIAALGPCALYGGQYTLDPNSFVSINEATTVAAVYALLPFFNASTMQVGASATNAIGLASAFQTAANLVNTASGQANGYTAGGHGAIPASHIYTLANIIAACANTDGTGAPCSTLFAAATPSGGTAPTNTLQALIDIAANPASNVATIYALATPSSPFQPSLTATPNDFTLVIPYTGIGLNNPVQTAFDAAGNLWIANSGQSVNSATVTEISNSGVLLSPTSGFSGGGQGFSIGMAIDPSGNVWVAGYGNDNIVKLSSSGTILSGASGYRPTGLVSPTGIAVDGSGFVWITNYSGGTANIIKMASDASSSQAFTSPNMNSPNRAAFDSAGNVWIASVNDGIVAELNSSGTTLSGSGYSVSHPVSILIDSSNTAWVPSLFTANVFHLSTSGTELAGASGYPTCKTNSAGFITNTCQAISGNPDAIDGAGIIWSPMEYIQANEQTHTSTYHYGLAAINSSGTLLTGNTGIGTDYNIVPASISIDQSGNLWAVQGGSNTLYELVGAATPVVTPLSVAVANKTIATRP